MPNAWKLIAAALIAAGPHALMGQASAPAQDGPNPWYVGAWRAKWSWTENGIPLEAKVDLSAREGTFTSLTRLHGGAGGDPCYAGTHPVTVVYVSDTALKLVVIRPLTGCGRSLIALTRMNDGRLEGQFPVTGRPVVFVRE